MSHRVETPHVDGSFAGTETDRAGSVEAYETDGGTVLHDAWYPLAWIESSVAVAIDEAH